MRLHRLNWLFAIPALLALTALLGWWWLLHTGSGAHWVLERAASASGMAVTTTRVTGNLSSGLQLEGLGIADDGVGIDIGTLRVALRIELLPLAAEVSTLHVENIALRFPAEAANEVEKEAEAGEFSMPIAVRFPDVVLSQIEILDPAGETSIAIDSLEAAGAIHDTLNLERLVVSVPEHALELSGQVALAPPFTLALMFQGRGRVEFEGSLRGGMDSAELVLDTTNPEIHISGSVTQLLDTPGWNLQVSSPFIGLPPEDEPTAATLTGLQAHTTGEWPRFNLDLTAALEVPELETLSLAVTGTGSNTGFSAQNLSLRGPVLSLDADGTFSWENGPEIGLKARLEHLQPGAWLPEWPDSHPVNGVFTVNWDGGDRASSEFSFSVAESAMTVSGQGSVALQSGMVDMALDWRQVAWPVGDSDPLVVSKQGRLSVSGKTDAWALTGGLELQSGDFPPGTFELSGKGDTESLEINIQEGAVLGGTVAGNVSWNWTGTQPFDARISAQRVDIAPLFPDVPGIISTQLTLNGAIEPFSLKAEILGLEGSVMDHPVSGKGGFHVEQGRVFADGLHLGSGQSALTLNGSLYEPGGIDFSVEVDSLARFSPDYQGGVTASGKVSLHPASPELSLSLAGRSLVLGDIAIDQLESRQSSLSGFENGSEINLTGIRIGPRPIESMTIRFAGDEPFQAIAMSVLVDDAAVELELLGSVVDWNDPLHSGWSGQLSRLQLQHPGGFILGLDQPADLELKPSRITLAPACFSGTDEAHLCASFSRLGPDDLALNANLSAIPVSFLEMAVDTDLKFTQVMHGSLDWAQTGDDGRNGMARLEISPGRIYLEEDEEIMLETGSGLFGFELAGGTLQKGRLDFTIPETGEIDVDFELPELGLGPDSPVHGKVRINFHDLAAFGPILPLFDSIGGALDIDMSLSGIASDPTFDGSAALVNAHVSNKASGFSFSEINLSGSVSDTDRSVLNGTFRAGEGTGNIGTTITFADMLTPVIELVLKGESLTLIDVPDLSVIANPDLVLAWRNSTLEINGRLFIPQARLSPSIIPQSSIRQSEDVVIVAGELPAPEDNFLRDNPIKVRGKLEVELGKQAEIILDMANVRVFGSTQFTWQDELLPVASGNFDIRGDIQAYGQTLKVTRGRISFPDIPADNPHLNIRAERPIYGNTQIQKAGLMVAGTLKRPVIEAYTIPATNKDRAQTLLVTGSDFNYEQGVGAVAVGTYVLPKLYISYGIGVFEEGNVIGARYDLGKRFGVKVTSGQKDTGLDLNYTIER